ncbi:hypothetical protein N2152v2_005381 [Parachlorella kessleri]
MLVPKDRTVEAPQTLTQTRGYPAQQPACAAAHQHAWTEADACRSGLVAVAAGLHDCQTKLQETEPHTYANLSQTILNAFFQAEKTIFQHFMATYWHPSLVLGNNDSSGNNGRSHDSSSSSSPATRAGSATGSAAGRGLLVASGPGPQAANAFINLWVIRHHLNSSIPIMLVYNSVLESDRLGTETQRFFEAHISNIQVVDGATLPYPQHMRPLFLPGVPASHSGWKIKIAALYGAPFKEVLVLDSDCMPLVDPLPLFDIPAYHQAGNLFWPDRYCMSQWVDILTPQQLYHSLGMPALPGDMYATDSGQFLFSREQHPDVLEWLLFLNVHDEFTYHYAYGDKDTFRAAFFLAGKLDSFQQDKWTGRGFLHHHPDNEGLLFLHRTSSNKYLYKPGAEEAHATSHLLLQPTCKWNRNHWYYSDAPQLDKLQGSRRLPVIGPSNCTYGLLDLAAARGQCALGGRKDLAPPILEVAPSSHLSTAQAAADKAFQLLLGAASGRPLLLGGPLP